MTGSGSRRGHPPRRVVLNHGDVADDAAAGAGQRRAVRAVVRDDSGRLLVLRTGRGAVKLPGGGVEPGESDEEALRREVREECGLEVLEVLGELGEIVEVAAARPEDPFEVFRMTSRYLACRVGDEAGETALSDAERALGLHATWLHLPEAVAANEPFAGAAGRGDDDHRFVRRESLVLGWLVHDDAVPAPGDRDRRP